MVTGTKKPSNTRALLSGSATIGTMLDRKSTRLNSSHSQISYAGFCLKNKRTRSYLSPDGLTTVKNRTRLLSNIFGSAPTQTLTYGTSLDLVLHQRCA